MSNPLPRVAAPGVPPAQPPGEPPGPAKSLHDVTGSPVDDITAPGLIAPGPFDSTGLRLRDTLRRGGWSICLLAVPLVVMEQLSREATSTLAPDIRNTFGISDAAFVATAGFTGVALVLGGIPMAWLAVRVNRKKLVVVSAVVGTMSLIGAGLAQNVWHLFTAYAFIGLAAAYSNPVFGSLIADAYPVEGRGRIYALHATATPIGQAVGPALAGSLAGLAGEGGESWRWAYIGLAVPYALLAIAAAVFLKEPQRGGADLPATQGDTAGPAAEERPVGIFHGFRQMMQVKTFLFMCLGIGVLGLALFTVPVQMSLLLGDEYHLDAFDRGLIFSLTQLPVIGAMVAGGQYFDRVFRQRPEMTVLIAGGSILVYGVIISGGIWFRPVWLLLAAYVLASMCVGIALVCVGPLVAAVSPHRLRAQAFAFLPVFTFLMGGFFGSIFAGFISDSFGPRTAITSAVAFSAFTAGLLFLRGRSHLRHDIAVAAREPDPVPV
ncbi:MFS transporter [Streptomyces sp. NBC_00690]|uniref:MFS transporter n=1 Tax=Streptomyces sp. NBC_00690 TaxID=2975808 RepID=UPI002E2A1DA4|nr:MFS transporter [Streptomyces sp. NBC_00690]